MHRNRKSPSEKCGREVIARYNILSRHDLRPALGTHWRGEDFEIGLPVPAAFKCWPGDPWQPISERLVCVSGLDVLQKYNAAAANICQAAKCSGCKRAVRPSVAGCCHWIARCQPRVVYRQSSGTTNESPATDLSGSDDRINSAVIVGTMTTSSVARADRDAIAERAERKPSQQKSDKWPLNGAAGGPTGGRTSPICTNRLAHR